VNDHEIIICSTVVEKTSVTMSDGEKRKAICLHCILVKGFRSDTSLSVIKSIFTEIEICVSFRSFRCAPLAKRHKISITRGRSPGLSQERMQEPISLYILDSPWIRPWPLTVFIHEFINC
jgi:hypothetical protein